MHAVAPPVRDAFDEACMQRGGRAILRVVRRKERLLQNFKTAMKTERAQQSATSLFDTDNVWLGHGLQAVDSKLYSPARAFDSAERDHGVNGAMLIDPNGPRLNL